jgi:hypothetical protein
MFHRFSQLLFGVAAVFASNVHAQTPLDKAPEGRPVSGWAIEVIPAKGGEPLDSYAQERGVGRVPVPIARVSFNDLAARTNAGLQTVHNGQAYFNVSDEGNYTFGIQIAQRDLPAFAINGGVNNCGVVFMVGGKNIGRGTPNMKGYYINGDPAADGSINFNVRLVAGIYKIAYIATCKRYETFHNSVSYELQVRGPDDNELRPFTNSELFYMQR